MSKLELIEVESRALELETKKFELEQRRATALSISAFFPDTLKKDVASAVIIYDLANRMNISVMEVSQSIYIIYGRPSFATSFLVARLNQSGLIKGALRTVVSANKQEAYCVAVDRETDEEMVGMTITMEMARKEGWVTKKGSKWQTMPELMLRKRSQSFFIKEFYPQVMFGLQSSEEVEDVEAIEAIVLTEKDDLNQAISQKPKTAKKVEKVPEPKEEEIYPTQEEAERDHPIVNEPVQEKPKAKRVPRYISKYYFTLEQYGIKKHDMRKFVDYMDWMEITENEVGQFFSQTPKEVTQYVNAFYGIEEDATEAEYEDVAEQSPEEVFGGVESPNVQEASQGAMATQTHASSTQKPKAGVSLARYRGGLISHGLKPEDVDDFIEWAKLDDTNMPEFIKDTGAVDSLIEEFNSELGYA